MSPRIASAAKIQLSSMSSHCTSTAERSRALGIITVLSTHSIGMSNKMVATKERTSSSKLQSPEPKSLVKSGLSLREASEVANF